MAENYEKNMSLYKEIKENISSDLSPQAAQTLNFIITTLTLHLILYEREAGEELWVCYPKSSLLSFLFSSTSMFANLDIKFFPFIKKSPIFLYHDYCENRRKEFKNNKFLKTYRDLAKMEEHLKKSREIFFAEEFKIRNLEIKNRIYLPPLLFNSNEELEKEYIDRKNLRPHRLVIVDDYLLTGTTLKSLEAVLREIGIGEDILRISLFINSSSKQNLYEIDI